MEQTRSLFSAHERRCRVLVVEDDRDTREALLDVLTDAAYDVTTVGHGAEALALLREDGERPCAIVLDLMMPVMDGREFRRHQQCDPSLSSIPLIVLTAHADREGGAMTVHGGTCLRKPVELDDLLGNVAAVCGTACRRHG